MRRADIRALLIYDYSISNIGNSFNERLHLYCPQAFQTIIHEENSSLNESVNELAQQINIEKRKFMS
ncbi:unnamed protein product [Adineta steineri]|uniref:Uncharacterized protein n=1 Tax=Adineta steineri TaxID=433720 RepID=A0A815RBE3_9BILA|nr:unnamed protein product [Adineta steineri]CAF1474297.1 unnamed protein product [Adineta steineri]